MAMSGRLVDRPKSKAGEPRVGAVVVLLYPIDDVLHIVYTKRPSSLRDHSGQISFPGGRKEDDESLEQAALRELEEEVGVSAESIHLLGRLTKMYVLPSDFVVHPFVAYAPQRPNFIPNPDEVATLIEAPLPLLLDPATRCEEERTFKNFNDFTTLVPYFDVFGHKIWGATGIMTGEFVVRWRTAFGN